MKCQVCHVESPADLCPEHFYEEFEKRLGVKPVWHKVNGEWVEVYEGIELKGDFEK